MQEWHTLNFLSSDKSIYEIEEIHAIFSASLLIVKSINITICALDKNVECLSLLVSSIVLIEWIPESERSFFPVVVHRDPLLNYN